MSEKLPRPGQVTLAGWLIVGGSLGVLVTVYDQLSRLRSLDTRNRIETALKDPALHGLGVGVNDVLEALHVLGLVAGACAAAAVVLGWHVLRRHRASRLALTILAVPLLLSGIASGGFFSTVVAVAVVLLWLPDARNWLDGRPAREPGTAAAPQYDAGRPTRPATSAGGRSAGWHPAQQPPPGGHPWPSPTPRPMSGRRPAAILWAAILTWVLCALGAIAFLAVGVIYTGDSKQLYDEMLRQYPQLRDGSITPDLAVTSLWIGVGMAVLTCAFTAVVAFLTVRGAAWARVLLVVFDSIAAAVLLLASLAAPVAVVGLGLAVVAVSLLCRPESRAWFQR